VVAWATEKKVMGYLLSNEMYNKYKCELTLSRENSLEVSREEQAGSPGA